jgi:hypothetical protein
MPMPLLAKPAGAPGKTVNMKENPPMDINELLANPDFVVTEEDAIAEGAIREMDTYGIATFRGDPVRTVSDTLFRALQNAFRLGATAGLTLTGQDLAETVSEMEDEAREDPGRAEYVAWLKEQDSFDGLTGLVPFWASLGELLQALIKDAADTAKPGEPQDDLYATPPLKALENRPVWLQRPKPGEWTAFFPEDY